MKSLRRMLLAALSALSLAACSADPLGPREDNTGTFGSAGVAAASGGVTASGG